MMTEDSWSVCTDPEAMLDFLEGESTSRKLRLFACACCRRIWPMLTDPRSREAVEVAERYADRLVGEDELEAAWRDAEKAADEQTALSIDAGTGPDGPHVSAAAAAMNAAFLEFTASDPEGSAPFFAASNALLAVAEANPSRASAERAAQSHLLRDIFGPLPFRPVRLDPAWRTPEVLGLGQAIYQERRFHDLALLADRLEDAGCKDREILEHCRGPGPHTVGCWVLDFVLRNQ